MFMGNLQEVLDEAKYVKFHDNGFTLAVWHGGHTVNFYSIVGNNEVEPTTCINVGDYETGETTLQDAQEGIETHFE